MESKIKAIEPIQEIDDEYPRFSKYEITFDTAWHIPSGIIIKMAKKYGSDNFKWFWKYEFTPESEWKEVKFDISVREWNIE